jgi:hypothetical protein
LSVVTPTYALQASDRLVATPSVGGCPPSYRDDERNKAVFVAERMTFAFTGRASIAGIETADFLQSQMGRLLRGGSDPDEALRIVGEMCAQALRTEPADARALAFVGVGWTSEPALMDRTPYIRWTSNSLGADEEWLPEPLDTFVATTKTIAPGDPAAVMTAGVRIDEDARGLLLARIASHTTQSGDPEPVARMLVETIRAEADRNPHVVGKGVMVTNLPIAPGPPDGDIHLISGMPTRDVRTFMYIPPGRFDGVWLGPLIVGSDGSQIGDIRSEGPGAVPGTTGVAYRPAGALPRRQGAVGQRIREPRPGRNDPCWCDSGRKFKKCHGP